MKRVLVLIDASDTECRDCEFLTTNQYSTPVCNLFSEHPSTILHGDEEPTRFRLQKCLEAEE